MPKNITPRQHSFLPGYTVTRGLAVAFLDAVWRSFQCLLKRVLWVLLGALGKCPRRNQSSRAVIKKSTSAPTAPSHIPFDGLSAAQQHLLAILLKVSSTHYGILLHNDSFPGDSVKHRPDCVVRTWLVSRSGRKISYHNVTLSTLLFAGSKFARNSQP